MAEIKKGMEAAEAAGGSKVNICMRWIPLQNAKSKRWLLCVIHDDHMSYDVTELESDDVQKIISYADYMNAGKEDGLGPEILKVLAELKRRYEANI